MVSESITSGSTDKQSVVSATTVETVKSSVDQVIPPRQSDGALTRSSPTGQDALERQLHQPPQPYARRERTDGITLLSFYHFAWSAVYLISALAIAVPTLITGIIGIAEEPEIFFVTVILGFALFFVLGLSLLYLAVGIGLWRLKHWGRTAALALGIVSLPTGIGTIPGALTVWYLMKEEVAALFR